MRRNNSSAFPLEEHVNLLDLRSESRFVTEIFFGAISIRNCVWPFGPDCLGWLACIAQMHCSSAFPVGKDVNPLDLRSESRFVIEMCFDAISIRNRVWPA